MTFLLVSTLTTRMHVGPLTRPIPDTTWWTVPTWRSDFSGTLWHEGHFRWTTAWANLGAGRRIGNTAFGRSSAVSITESETEEETSRSRSKMDWGGGVFPCSFSLAHVMDRQIIRLKVYHHNKYYFCMHFLVLTIKDTK